MSGDGPSFSSQVDKLSEGPNDAAAVWEQAFAANPIPVPAALGQHPGSASQSLWRPEKMYSHAMEMPSGYNVHPSLTHSTVAAPLPAHITSLQHGFPYQNCSSGFERAMYVSGIEKRPRSRTSHTKPLARSFLRPVATDANDSVGPRRRGRPPGSGNRKRMAPQKTGPDGKKKFSSRSVLYTGVYKTPPGRWRALISHQGKVVQLGMYDSERAAAHRWDIEAVRLRGTSTQLNFADMKPTYIALLTKLTREYEGNDVDFSLLLDEDMIRREIYDPGQNNGTATIGIDGVNSARLLESFGTAPTDPSKELDASAISLCPTLSSAFEDPSTVVFNHLPLTDGHTLPASHMEFWESPPELPCTTFGDDHRVTTAQKNGAEGTLEKEIEMDAVDNCVDSSRQEEEVEKLPSKRPDT